MKNNGRNLNWLGALIAVIAALAAFGIEHIAALNLPPALLPIIQAALLLIVAVTGWAQKKYALPDDQRMAKLLAAVPPDALAQIAGIINGVKAEKEAEAKKIAQFHREREQKRLQEMAAKQAEAESLRARLAELEAGK